MSGDKSYLYCDIEDSIESFESIKMLINSIKTGRFKNLKNFSNNDKTKGLLEVRDISNKTRILFEPIGNKTYCIIGGIVDKRETNSIYKERLINRFSKYKNDKNYSIDENILNLLKV